jgi:small subunit ribosomal protein S11
VFFAFIKRRYWWPRYNYVLSKKSSSFLLKKNRNLRFFYLIKSRRSALSIIKFTSSFPALFSKSWLHSTFEKHSQKRAFSYRLFRFKSHFLAESKKKLIRISKIWIRFSSNNVFFSVTDSKNRLLTYFSSGLIGFSGPTKTSSFALDQVVDKVFSFFVKRNIKTIQLIFLSGMFNYKSRSVVEALTKKGLFVRSITYKINVPHNGLRQRKAKRR